MELAVDGEGMSSHPNTFAQSDIRRALSSLIDGFSIIDFTSSAGKTPLYLPTIELSRYKEI